MCTVCRKCTSICEMLFIMYRTHFMSPVSETQDSICIKLKMLLYFGASEIMCRIESQKAMKCVLVAVNVCICEMLFLACTEHTSTTLLVNEAQDYDY